MKQKRLVIFGTGETARLAFEYFMHDSPYEVCAFVIDPQFASTGSSEFMGLPITHTTRLADKHPPDQYEVFVAMGSSRLNHDRAEVCARMRALSYTLASYVSSRAFVWHDVRVGCNCLILENNVLQSGVTIGDNTTLWSGNHVGHRAEIGENCFLTSHVVISGFCAVGEHSFIGVNACVADRVQIASFNFIGMGAVVNKNTEPDAIYTGNPAEKSRLSARRFCKI